MTMKSDDASAANTTCRPSRSGPTMVRANGVDLCIDTFGDPNNPALLLIGGAAAAMDWWEEAFCERLAAAGRFAIRYDNRDTGRSTSYEPGSPRYTGPDLVEDAIGILDVFGIERAHIVGLSMGGGIGLLLGIEQPDRVASLTLISTSPGGPGGPDNPDLPPMSEKLQAVFADEGPQPDWSDRDAVIDYMVEGERPFAGTIPFDEANVRNLAAKIVDRTNNMASTMTNHWMIAGGEPIRSRLDQITAPTLVMHGTEDPLFPYGHGEALASEIPGARLIALKGGGHQYPPRALWDVVIPALVEHTSYGA